MKAKIKTNAEHHKYITWQQAWFDKNYNIHRSFRGTRGFRIDGSLYWATIESDVFEVYAIELCEATFTNVF
jgi:hypothetical protein